MGYDGGGMVKALEKYLLTLPVKKRRKEIAKILALLAIISNAEFSEPKEPSTASESQSSLGEQLRFWMN